MTDSTKTIPTGTPADRASRTCHGQPQISFEVFPPKNDNASTQLDATLDRLAPLSPSFVSVTYGAGGSTRERSFAVVDQVVQAHKLPVAAHVTCVGVDRDDVDATLRRFADSGVTRVVAFRGDPPSGIGGSYEPHPTGYRETAQLVSAAKRIGGFDVAVSAYPERHPQSPSIDHDLDVLQAKVDAGADRAITQMFFDNDSYFRYVDRVRARDITIPIVPGILPIQNFQQVAGFSARCGAHIPDWLAARFDGLHDDPETHRLVAAAVAAEQILELVDAGVCEFHLYTMNRAELAFAICHLVGLRASSPVAATSAA